MNPGQAYVQSVLEDCNQSPEVSYLKNWNIEKAFDTDLLKMEEHQISLVKIVAPYRVVNSMEGREFTGYLKKQHA